MIKDNENNLKGLKAAVIGDHDSILAFNALGMEIYPVKEPEEAAKILDKLAEGGYAIVYITEQLAAEISDTIFLYRNADLPAIVPIPSILGNPGIGMQQITDSVKKAVGIDILGTEDK